MMMINHYFPILHLIQDGLDDYNLPTDIIWTVRLDDSIWLLLET